MGQVGESLGKVKAMVITEWCVHGIPPALLETLASHVLEEALIALKLSKLSGCDEGKAVLLALAQELGSEFGELKELLDDACRRGARELIIAKLAHELALALQAKRYAKMGFKTDGSLRKHVEEALKAASELPQSEVAQLVHELLTS